MSNEFVFIVKNGRLEPHVTNYDALFGKYKDGDIVVLNAKKGTRTDLQNNSIHLFCDKAAKALNEAGYDQKQVLEAFRGAELENTMLSIKESVFKKIMNILTGYESTTELKTDEVDIVYRNCNLLFNRLGITIDPPSRFNE